MAGIHNTAKIHAVRLFKTTAPTDEVGYGYPYYSSIDGLFHFLNEDGADVALQSVLQVVSAVKTDSFSTSSATYTDVTGLSVSITPKFASSRILVLAVIHAGADHTMHVRLVRGSTAVGVGDASSARVQSSTGSFYNADSNQIEVGTILFVDSPATTAATTYKVQMRTEAAASTNYVNRSISDVDSAASSRTISAIVAIEVA